MAKRKKREPGKGTDKQMLAAVESPVAGHEAEQPVVYGAVTHDMSTKKTDSGETQVRQLDLDVPAQPSAVSRQAQVEADPPEPVQAELLNLPPESTDKPPLAAAPATLAQRLRSAREAKGWSVEEVGSRLRLPAQIINSLEAEQYDRIGYGVYLRGYLNSYARLVDVPTLLVDRLMGEYNHAPPLVTSGTISHSRYLYQRYSVSALYLILTGVIIVPAVLLAMRASLQPTISQLTPLEAPAANSANDAAPATVAVNEPPKPNGGSGMAARADATLPAVSDPEAPLVASLAPFSALSRKDTAVHAEATPPLSGGHTVKLILKEASWVEVTSASGEKLEYGLLPAGSERTYATAKPLDLRLGNSNGAEVEVDGKAQDLAPYRRANVAHFKLFSAGEPISHSDG